MGKVNAVLQKPHGVLAAFVFNAAPIFRAKLPAQKLFIFLLWPFPHIKYGDALRAVGLVSACAERQINDLLRHRARRDQNAGGRICRSFVHRGVTAHVEQSELFCHDRGILQTQFDLILAAFNQPLGHFGND